MAKKITDLELRAWLREVEDRPACVPRDGFVYVRCDRASDIPFLLHVLEFDRKQSSVKLTDLQDGAMDSILSALSRILRTCEVDDQTQGKIIATML